MIIISLEKPTEKHSRGAWTQLKFNTIFWYLTSSRNPAKSNWLSCKRWGWQGR